MRISDWSSDVCSSDLPRRTRNPPCLGAGGEVWIFTPNIFTPKIFTPKVFTPKVFTPTGRPSRSGARCIMLRGGISDGSRRMAENEQSARLAILIDADNTSAAYAHAIFEEVAKLGEANVRRIYGDFASDRLRSWREVMHPLAILPQQQFNYTVGKNAADIALVIDAMDLMHRSRLDGFCLVSSDSDFTRLAQRLREDGALVYGFGARKTPEAFRNACSRFIYIENLLEPTGEAAAGGVESPKPNAAKKTIPADAAKADKQEIGRAHD